MSDIHEDLVDLKRQIAIILERQNHIRRDLTDLLEYIKALDTKFVTKQEFWPVKTLVYGLVGLILLGVVGALLALVIQQGGKLP